MQETLKNYKKAVDTLKEFKDANESVFATFEAMQDVIAKLEENIKVQARELGDQEYENIQVKVVERWNKGYNWKKLTEGERAVLNMNDGVEHKINSKVFEQLVEAGAITKETRQKAYEEIQGTSAVSIKVK